MKPAFASTVSPPLSDRERDWCLQFIQALELQEILYLSPVAESIQERAGWIERHLENNHLQKATALSKTECEAIWVLGIGDGLWFDRAFEWLEAEDDRFLLIVETKVAHLRAFLRSDRSKDRWNHPKVALLLLDPKHEITGENTLRLAAQLLTDTRARGLSHPSYGQSTSQTLIWNLLRGVISEFQEVKRAHLMKPDLMAHAFRNSPHIGVSKFHDHLSDWLDEPIILCGAGPSFHESIETLKLLQGRTLIISCGTASQILMDAKLEPDWVAGVCPYFLHYDRFRRIDYLETPSITGLTVHPGVMRSMSGFKVLLKGLTHLDALEYLEEGKGSVASQMVDYGYSVLTSTLKACVDMGAKKIILVGVDLCYVNDHKYGRGADVIRSAKVEESAGEETLEVNAKGDQVASQGIWLQERAWIENFIRLHPQIELIQASKQGLPIKGAGSYRNWESMLVNLDAWSLQRDQASISWQAYQNAPENPKHIDASFLLNIQKRLADVESFSLNRMRQVQLIAKDPDLSSMQPLLTSYLQRLQAEPSFKGFLSKIDSCLASMQVRQFWKMSRDPKMKDWRIQKQRKINLLVERMSQMAKRLGEWQASIEEVVCERGWRKSVDK